jgi:hypothetical protein
MSLCDRHRLKAARRLDKELSTDRERAMDKSVKTGHHKIIFAPWLGEPAFSKTAGSRRRYEFVTLSG